MTSVVISNDTPDAATALLDHWSNGKLWARGTDASLVKGWKKLSPSEAWVCWQQHLASRKSIASLAKLVKGEGDAELWSLDSIQNEALTAWHRNLTKLSEKSRPARAEEIEATIIEPLAEVKSGSGNGCQIEASFRAVSIAWQIERLAAVTVAADWWRIVAELLDISRSASLGVVSDDSNGTKAVVVTHLAGEIPLVLSYLLPELTPTRSLRDEARHALGEGLLSLTDGEGMVAADFVTVLPMLAACWTRARAVGSRFKKNCWSASAETQYEWLVRQLLRMTRADGQLMFADAPHRDWCPGVITTALALAGDASDRLAAVTRHGKAGVDAPGRASAAGLPDATVNSEWGGVAVLAGGWSPDATQVGVTYRGTSMTLDIVARGKQLLKGDWLSHSSAAGTPLPITGHWEEQCWFSDDEIDYLDVAVDLAGGARLERQIAFLKQDDALLLHEVLLTKLDDPQPLTHEAHLPLATKLSFVPEIETRDGLIVAGNSRVIAAVMPLSLAEWRTDTRPGELTTTSQFIELSQQRMGQRLSVPLWFDLNPTRAKKQRTWRQLTVAEKLERQPHDVAVGYRIQSGDQQWVVYRSLAAAANRTLLGQNLSSESYMARFDTAGAAHELIEIEASEE